MNADGNSFDVTPTGGAMTVPFRPYFIADGSGARQYEHILFDSSDSSFACTHRQHEWSHHSHLHHTARRNRQHPHRCRWRLHGPCRWWPHPTEVGSKITSAQRFSAGITKKQSAQRFPAGITKKQSAQRFTRWYKK